MKRILLILALTSSCQQPAAHCETQFDCFGGELCVDGACSKQIVVIDDDSGALNSTATDMFSRDLGADQGSPPDLRDLPDVAMGFDSGADMGACAEACGESEVCIDGSCAPAPAITEWTLNGTQVNLTKTAEVLYTESSDAVFVGLPYWGRNIQINLLDVSMTSTLSISCANQAGTFALSLITSDNGWADLDDLPARWQGLTFTGGRCSPGPDDDRLVTWNLELVQLSAARVRGTVEIEIEGAGPRAGETLLITSAIDAQPDRM